MYLSDESLYSCKFLCIIIMIVDYNSNLTYERLVLDSELSTCSFSTEPNKSKLSLAVLKCHTNMSWSGHQDFHDCNFIIINGIIVASEKSYTQH